MNSVKSSLKEKHLFNLISIIFALTATITTPFILKENMEYSLSNSLFSVVLFIGYYVISKKALENFEKRLSVTALITGFVFDVFMVLGRNIYVTNGSGLAEVATWLSVLGMLPIFYASTLLVIKYLPKLNCNFITDNAEKKKSTFFVIWSIIFGAWIPALLASYPGMYGYDSIYQIRDYLADNVWLNHPPMHTYLLSLCVVDLGRVLGSHEAGMLCYSIIQMLCLSATFATIYTVYIRARAAKLVRRIVLLIFMFLPTNAIMSFSATKDVLFSAFFALAVMLLLLLAEKPDLIKSIKYDISLCLIFFMIAVWRNQGLYVILLTFIVAILFMWRYKKYIFAVFTTSILLILFYSNFICPWLGFREANSIREMMSVPCVQLSRAMLYNEDELTKEECRLIKEYVPDYEAYSYNSGISDLMKKTLATERIQDNPMEFIKLWIKVGVKCPITYIDAFARLTIGYWYPDMNYRDVQAFHPYWEYYSTGILYNFDEEKYLLLDQAPVKGFEWLHKEFYELSYENDYQSIALVSLLFSSGLSVWLVIFYIAVSIYRKEYKYLVPASFAFTFILTLLLGPVVLYRYIYPIILTCPMLLVSLISFKMREDNKFVMERMDVQQ